MKHILQLVFLTSLTIANAQNQYAGTSRVVESTISSSPLSFITEVSGSEYSKLSGSQYLFDSWFETEVFTLDGQHHTNITAKLNIHNYTLDVQSGQVVKMVSYDVIDSLIIKEPLKNRIIHCAAKYHYSQDENIPLIGFAEKLTSGKISLLRVLSTKIAVSNYNAALDLGEKGDKIIRSDVYYLLDQSGNVYSLPRSKRKLKEISLLNGQKLATLKSYMQEKSLKMNKEEDLMILVQKIDELVRS